MLRVQDNPANVNGIGKNYLLSVLLSDLSVLYISDNAFYHIEEKKDGWVRLGIGITKGSSSTRVLVLTAMSTLNYYNFNPGFTGDGVNGMEYFGAQLEYDKMTSLIPTGASTVTRLKDKIEVTTPQGVTEIVNTIDGVEQSPITTIPTTYEVSRYKLGEELVVNGNFKNNGEGWNKRSLTTIVDGVAYMNYSNFADMLNQPILLHASIKYLVKCIVTTTSGGLRIQATNTSLNSSTPEVIIVPSNTVTSICFIGSGDGFVGSIKEFSIREILGEGNIDKIVMR